MTIGKSSLIPVLLGHLWTGGCLNVGTSPTPKDQLVSINGMWQGRIHFTRVSIGSEVFDPVEVGIDEEQDDIMLALEHSGGRVMGVYQEIPNSTILDGRLRIPPNLIQPYTRGACREFEFESSEGIIHLRFEQGDTVLMELSYDEMKEMLSGTVKLIRPPVNLVGDIKLDRVSYLAIDNPWDPQRLGCIEYVSSCSDGVDNDGNGFTDEADRSCLHSYNSFSYEEAYDICQDGVDNDDDGLTDAEDSECPGGEWGNRFSCWDNIDNDRDGVMDADDPDCFVQPCQWIWGELRCTGIGEHLGMCEDGVDNDGDGLFDLADPDCEDSKSQEGDAAECSNGFDDDRDGLTDTQDPACSQEYGGNSEWGTSCDDGLDNDGDGYLDWDDAKCQVPFRYTESGIWVEEDLSDCNDGIDNDGDGQADMQDDHCILHFFEYGEVAPRSVPHQYGGIMDCWDGVDNDGDGRIDNADTGCLVWPHLFESVPHCLDNVDNDGDGRIDAEDSQCPIPLARSEDACSDGFDNDQDGLIDGDDPHCAVGSKEFGAECADGIDNDGDGLADYPEDPKCHSLGDPRELARCADGLDNDFDRLIDLADPDCQNDPQRDRESAD